MRKKAEEDDGFNVVIMLAFLKKEMDALKLEKEKVVQAKHEAQSKVEQLFTDKAELKLLHQEIESELSMPKISLEDVEKQ